VIMSISIRFGLCGGLRGDLVDGLWSRDPVCGGENIARKPVLPAGQYVLSGSDPRSRGVWSERCSRDGGAVHFWIRRGDLSDRRDVAKSLLNGPCGVRSNGKCEVDKDLDCGLAVDYR